VDERHLPPHSTRPTDTHSYWSCTLSLRRVPAFMHACNLRAACMTHARTSQMTAALEQSRACCVRSAR
jgi:hypothetical protein